MFLPSCRPLHFLSLLLLTCCTSVPEFSSPLSPPKLVLHVLYGFFIGATFWNTPTNLDDQAGQLASSCIWFIMLQAYIHVFKVNKTTK